MINPSPAGKAAELASGLGAVALGAGLALVAPEALRTLGLPILVVGIVVHAAGMTLKSRLERRNGSVAVWEQVLFWLCWATLAGLLVWIAIQLA
jgi:uncharacterized membrane protein YecN with MAPEG domain